MKVEINTSAKNVESANAILGQAIKELSRNKDWRESLGFDAKDIQNAKMFRKKLLKGFLNKDN